MYTICISTKELAKGARLAKNHIKKDHENISKDVRFHIVPTSTEIGQALHLKCSWCGFDKDITDYKSW